VSPRSPRRLPSIARASAEPRCALVQERPALPVAAAQSQLVPLPDTATLFRRYAGYVAAIGIRILGRQDEIEDFVQDVFINVHRYVGQLRDPAALKGWLARLAVHEATRRLERRKLRVCFGLSAAAALAEYSAAVDPATSPEDHALLAHVFAALDRLPAHDRVAWSLRHLEHETMERVAKLCSCSLSTAKRRVSSAEQALEELGVDHER
jgi:RNA polymerase sigma-70 factor (ECF subfamily)